MVPESKYFMGVARTDEIGIDSGIFYYLAGKPALQEAGARYNSLTITITRMITIKRPIMMTSLVLGGLMKDRRLKFDCLPCTALDAQSVLFKPWFPCAGAQSIKIGIQPFPEPTNGTGVELFYGVDCVDKQEINSGAFYYSRRSAQRGGRLACASRGNAKINRPKRKQIRNVMAVSVCVGALDILVPVKPVQQAMKYWREEKRGGDNEGQPRIERVKPGEEFTRDSLWHIDRPHATQKHG